MEPSFTQKIEPVSSPIFPVPNTGFSAKKLLFIFGLVVVLFIIWQLVSNPMIVTVTGSGTVSVPATSASLSFNILSSGNSVQEAIANVKAKSVSITSIIKAKGIAEADIIQTQITAAPATNGQGYQALIQMGAKTININGIPDLITVLYINGVSSVSQPVFSVENSSSLQTKAIEDAMKDANTQSKQLAKNHFKLFRKIINVSQTSSGTTSTTTSKPDPLTGTNNQQAATNGVFKIIQAVSVSYKMW